MNTVKIKEAAQDIRGNILNISLNEESVDINALKTIENSYPDFIVPFTRKVTDGEMEFTYNLQGLLKLLVLSGNKTKDDYLQMWGNILTPLIEFDDWFMKSSSFLFDIDYIYVDMRTNKIKYIYIPTIEKCSGSEDLRSMLVDIEGQNQTLSHDIAHPILRALNGRNFNIIDLKKIIDKLKYSDSDEQAPKQDIQKNEYTVKSSAPIKTDDEIIINVPKKQKKPLFSFNRKEKAKKEENELIDGAAADPANDFYKLDSLINSTDIVESKFGEETELFDEDENKQNQVFLKLIGNADFSDVINIVFSDKNVFSIGRFDSKAGIAQNDFEFSGGATGISRRQAVIHKNGDTYSIIHVGSAYTFVNGTKMSAGETLNIKNGDKISFGKSGADYVFNI